MKLDSELSSIDNNEVLYTPETQSGDEELCALQETPRNMSVLESEEFAAQRNNQTGQTYKILTPDQMLSRLPITLAQLQAENNSQKVKNEIK